MRILFYSTSSNFYDGEAISTITLPSFCEQWNFLAKKHSEHEFLLATQLPAMFLCDVIGNEIATFSEKQQNQTEFNKVQLKLIESDNEKKISEELFELKPDLAIAISFYVTPYDWLPIKDAIVADFLREKGIRTICHSVETALISFDKWQTHEFLEKISVNTAKAVHLQHELYINAGNRREIKSNVYTSAVFHEIKKLHFPVIIKDTTGLSSFGADVVNSFEEALGILKSKKTTSDRIIEEMISGEQFGVEIYGIYNENSEKGDYTIFPPFKFSVNQYGITSPKQSVKFGPIGENEEEYERYKIADLNEMLLKLANSIKIDGIAQIDLVFDGQKWFIIEINPRLSGMSTTYAASTGKFLNEIIFEKLKIEKEKWKIESKSAFDKLKHKKILFCPTLNIKFPILERTKLNELKSLPYVAFVNQIENKAARQIREQGYCEVILVAKTRDKLFEEILDLRKKFSEFVEETFFDKAIFMLKKHES